MSGFDWDGWTFDHREAAAARVGSADPNAVTKDPTYDRVLDVWSAALRAQETLRNLERDARALPPTAVLPDTTTKEPRA